MSRLGTVLLMFLMTWPMVRDCCLPVTHALPCHESKPKPTDDTTCFSTQEAIAETKTAPCKVVRNVMPGGDAAEASSEIVRSEERRVGKEWRSRWGSDEWRRKEEQKDEGKQ